MAKIDYPTIDILEAFLKNIYNNSISFSNSNIVNILGNKTGNYINAGQYGSLYSVTVNTLTGIDIPVLLTNNNNVTKNKTIAIVAQDPLRNIKDLMLNNLPINNPIIGTPFAIHYQESCYPQTSVYRKIIRGILKKGINVYITDAHKIYPNIKKKTKEFKLLQDELKIIQPDTIVTFGSIAKDYVNGIQTNNKIKILNLLHPSQSNWDHWRQWIFEQAFCNNMVYNIQWQKYALQLGSRTHMFGNPQNVKNQMPDIIANITLDMI